MRRLDHIERTGVGIACWTKWAHGEGDNEYNVFTAAVLHLLPHPPRVLSAPMQELRPRTPPGLDYFLHGDMLGNGLWQQKFRWGNSWSQGVVAAFFYENLGSNLYQ